MKPTQLLGVVWICVLLVGGCSSSKHRQLLSSADRAQLSSLEVVVIDDREPGPQSALLEITGSGFVSSYEIVGYRGWTKERYGQEANANCRRIGTGLEQVPDRHFEAVIREILTQGSEGYESLTLVEEGAEASGRLELDLYHKAGPDFSYCGLRGRILNADGEQVFDHQEFSMRWKTTDDWEELFAKMDRFVARATKSIWASIAR